MTEGWRRWEGEVVNGVFPLQRFLNGSDHSAVFLTEDKAHQYAAIKIIPADKVAADTQFSYWRTAGTLSYPHLIRFLDTGRCQLEGRPYLFVVMEYADQTLAQILPHRALTADEVRDMLVPTLDVLALLHRKYLVQGRLTPTNLLVVDDRLKLASDTIRPAGEPAACVVKPSCYDAPEAKNGRIAAAGDIWSLGVTLFEALTQSAPAWSDERRATLSLPESLPAPFADIIRRCLKHDPADRPTAKDIEAELRGMPPDARAIVSQPLAREVPAPAPAAAPAATPAAPAQKLPAPRRLALAAAVVLVVVLALWIGLRRAPAPVASGHADAPAVLAAASTVAAPSALAAANTAADPTATAAPPAALAPASPGAAGSVIHEEIPTASRGALATIHGHVRVAVRVSVDASGTVVEETLEDPGPSQYFARLATEAGRKWTFAPADDGKARAWLLHFEFAPDGAAAHATPRR
ncbi:MAG TPA: protein kinase [Steroidobacteraceae bacterium]|nr:protein kinase [Steroidobacteraceae bacterium]